MITCSKTRAGMGEQKAGTLRLITKAREEMDVYRKKMLNGGIWGCLFVVLESRGGLIQNIWISASEKCYQ